MGQVYRARDVKLERQVALKVLPEKFASDAERISRFQREARVLASLNHPHIAQIYGLEESGGISCLVLELVEGAGLDRRLEHGPIPIEEALEISRQIALGLETAHERGILHRDLKPANVKLTAGGSVKILDFGLAKIFETGRVPSNLSESPTLLTEATRSDVLLGTPSYMSPEQVRGKPTDERSDVWAFGCVLYELLTGKQAFSGDSVAETMGAITKADPAWSALPPETSPNIQRLLRRCLQKDPARRLHHIADARIEIEEALSDPIVEGAVPLVNVVNRRSPTPWLAGAGVGLILGAALVWTGLHFRRVTDQAPKMQLEISAPGRSNMALAISPDGRSVVFHLTEQGGTLWLRPLDSGKARPLPGTEGALFPFWSPDSRSLAFFANGKLRRLEVAGGPAQVIADAPNPRGGAWNTDGTILFNAVSSGPLSRISLDGSSLRAATQLEKDQGSHRYPQFLPDGRHFLYFAIGKPEVSGVYVGSLDSNESKRILASDAQAVYAGPRHLLFLRQGVLLAQPFDLKELALTGVPFPQAERVATTFTGHMVVSAADNGTVAYRTRGVSDSKLTWFDRSGAEAGSFALVGEWACVELSPDGTRVAAQKTENGNADLWMLESSRGIATRLTSNSADDESPVWSPDGTRIAFDSNRKGAFDLYQMSIKDIGKESPLMESSDTKTPLDWSPDGRYFLFAVTDEKTGRDIWARPFFGAGAPFPVIEREFDQAVGSFSPDSRWIAYESNESGRSEVYIQPFPESGERLQVSLDGGGDPRWRGDGKEIFYLAPDGTLMAATVSVNAGNKQIQAGKPTALFRTLLGTLGRPHGYDVDRDGRRFLVPTPVEKNMPPITILLNWAGQ